MNRLMDSTFPKADYQFSMPVGCIGADQLILNYTGWQAASGTQAD
jgi:hypothetical protein